MLPPRPLIALLALCLIHGGADAGPTRSSAAKAEFKAGHPCPANGRRSGACPGYVIDHLVPLACGGADAPRNMQWQTIAAAKLKDRWELDCSVWRQ